MDSIDALLLVLIIGQSFALGYVADDVVEEPQDWDGVHNCEHAFDREGTEVHVCEMPPGVAGLGKPGMVAVGPEYKDPGILLHELAHAIGYSHAEMEAQGGRRTGCGRAKFILEAARAHNLDVTGPCETVVTPWGEWPTGSA